MVTPQGSKNASWQLHHQGLVPASPQHSWRSWKLETWSSWHSLQVARQFGRHLFQAGQLLRTSSKQFSWAQQSLPHMLCWRRIVFQLISGTSGCFWVVWFLINRNFLIGWKIPLPFRISSVLEPPSKMKVCILTEIAPQDMGTSFDVQSRRWFAFLFFFFF